MGAFSNMDYELQNSEAAVSDAFTEDDAMDMSMMHWIVLPVIPTRRAIPSPSSMTMRETWFPLLTVTAIPPAIPTMD